MVLAPAVQARRSQSSSSNHNTVAAAAAAAAWTVQGTRSSQASAILTFALGVLHFSVLVFQSKERIDCGADECGDQLQSAGRQCTTHANQGSMANETDANGTY
jgi:hypothetical protein